MPDDTVPDKLLLRRADEGVELIERSGGGGGGGGGGGSGDSISI
jgi:hypothetical protein